MSGNVVNIMCRAEFLCESCNKITTVFTQAPVVDGRIGVAHRPEGPISCDECRRAENKRVNRENRAASKKRKAHRDWPANAKIVGAEESASPTPAPRGQEGSGG